MQKNQVDEILSASSYRGFIEKYLKNAFPRGGRSYAEAARRGGLSSRAAVTDIMKGRRRVTAHNYHGIVRGLQLRGPFATLFKLLVAKEEPDLNLYSYKPEQLDQKISQLKTKIRSKSDRQIVEKQRGGKLQQIESYGQIYAAMVTDEDCGGTSVETIHRITQIPVHRIKSNVTTMVQLGMIQQVKELHYAPVEKFFDVAMDSDWQSHQRKMLYSIGRMAQLIRKLRSVDPEVLFTEASFSVRKADIPALKAKVREDLMDFMVKNESTDGEALSVLNLFVSMYPEDIVYRPK